MPQHELAMIDSTNIAKLQSQAVIVGAGLAGLYTALKLSPKPAVVISPLTLGNGASSSWAQGGIAAAIGEGDSPQKHARDTISVGGGLVDENVASSVAREASDRIYDLLSYGVPFDKDLEGKLALSREAAHSEPRIVRVKGDMAGQTIMKTLIKAVRYTPSITVLENCRAEEVLSDNGHITGLLISARNKVWHLQSSNIVIASGGVGGLYKVTTNPATSSGEGLGMAARAGAVIADAEFVQFHPTALDVGIDPAPLATEALRGEGGILVDNKGKRFMPEYHRDAELAPRDIVARAVYDQVSSGSGAFLDCREALGEKFPVQFPTVYEKCLQAGIDPTKDPIPIAPAAHYHMGGIKTDNNGRTTLPGLWACGEVASTGMHGANRLASNSLLETIVYGWRIAEILKHKNNEDVPLVRRTESRPSAATSCTKTVKSDIRTIMTDNFGVIRDGYSMEKALAKLGEIYQRGDIENSVRNMIITSEIIARSALYRRESRGSHYRSDWPQLREKACHSYIKLNDNGDIKLLDEREVG